jgi:hypothetical protein
MRDGFTANQVVCSADESGLVVGFGKDGPDRNLVNYLTFLRDTEDSGPRSVYLEFNDQGNACTGERLDAVRLGDDRLTVVLRPPPGIRAGTVDGVMGPPLLELEVRFETPLDNLRRIRLGLESILAGGCAFSYVGTALAG